MERDNEPRGRVPERGAAEEASGVPLTETEMRANTRPPSKPEIGHRGDNRDAKPDGSNMPGHPDAPK